MAKAKKKHVRIDKKRLETVAFEVPFYDGEFEFPAQKHMPQGLMIALDEGKVAKLRDWLLSAGTDEGDVEAFLDLDAEDAKTFVEAWGKGQLANAPKSSD